MILSGKPAAPEASSMGMPWGRQWAGGDSLCPASVIRSLVRAWAQGWMGNSPGLKSAARLVMYLWFCLSACQIPERSGLPSDFRGAGAERSGLPSFVRGMPLVGTFSHWADAGKDVMIAI